MIIFLYGQDSYRSSQKMSELKDKFTAQVDKTGASISIIEGEDFDINELREQLMSPALFSKEKMIILKNIIQSVGTKKDKDELMQLLDKADSNVIVIWEHFADKDKEKKVKKTQLFSNWHKTKYAQEFKLLNTVQLEQWIVSRVKELGGDISLGTARLISSLLGNNLWLVDNELQKLVLYTGQREISRADVELMVRQRLDDNIWQFTDALARGQNRIAVSILTKQLLLGNEPAELMNKMIWQFRILLLVKSLLTERTLTSQEIATYLGLHPYVAQKALPVVKNFTLQKLQQIYERLLGLDLQLKTGQADSELLLDMFVVML